MIVECSRCRRSNILTEPSAPISQHNNKVDLPVKTGDEQGRAHLRWNDNYTVTDMGRVQSHSALVSCYIIREMIIRCHNKVSPRFSMCYNKGSQSREIDGKSYGSCLLTLISLLFCCILFIVTLSYSYNKPSKFY